MSTNKITFQLLVCSGTTRASKNIIWSNKLVGIKGPAARLSHAAIRFTLVPETARILKICSNSYNYDCVMESTSLNKWAGKSGFQINPYRAWLNQYPGSVWKRDISFYMDLQVFEDLLIRFVQTHQGKPYESGIAGTWELLLCLLRLHRLPNLAQLHCTETFILFVQWLRLYSSIQLPNNFPPHTCWENEVMEMYLRGCVIGPCRQLK